MNFVSGIINGFREAWAHKFRSLLSMIGIVLGVASLVAMMGVAKGLIEEFRLFFEKNGGIEKVVINDSNAPNWQSTRKNISPGRTLNDAKAIRNHVPLASYVSPEVDVRWKPIEYNAQRIWVHIMGLTPEFVPIYDTQLQAGRFISDIDVEERRSVAVVGSVVCQRMGIKPKDIIGKKVTIQGHSFVVIGVLEEISLRRNGQNIWRWKNRITYIPVTTAQHMFGEPGKITYLNVRISDPSRLNELSSQIQNTLLTVHRDIHDISVDTREDALAKLEQKEAGFTYSLGSLAIISLLVGGIGITNVMLASINERIREIGVRKAVGARASDIFIQFIAESVSISLVGGLLGILASLGLVALVQGIMPEETVTIVLTSEAFVIGFVFSVITGIVSGIYPALKAARLDPITALRYE